MSSPLILAGIVYDSDGVTPIENARVWVYNKTNNESKNYNDTNFTELLTNSNGEWMVNLANFSKDWNIGDTMWVSAFYEDKAQSITFTLTGIPESNHNLTLKNLEPAVAVMKLLWTKISDPNTSRDDITQMIRPRFPLKELTKSDYPRIIIFDMGEESELVGTSNTNKSEERIYKIKIIIYVWAKTGDAHVLTIDGSKYEGTKLRDYLAREVSEALRKEFYQRPAYNRNAIVQKFYDYSKTNMESMGFDEIRDNFIMKKEIDIQVKSIEQEV